jgi:hypothetical protein
MDGKSVYYVVCGVAQLWPATKHPLRVFCWVLELPTCPLALFLVVCVGFLVLVGKWHLQLLYDVPFELLEFLTNYWLRSKMYDTCKKDMY